MHGRQLLQGPPLYAIGCSNGCSRCRDRAAGLAVGARVDDSYLGGVVGFVYPHQAVGEYEHLTPQADNEELGTLRSPLQKVCDDGDVFEVCVRRGKRQVREWERETRRM